MPCLDETTAALFAQRSLEEGSAREVERHIDTCESCRRLIAALAKGSERELGVAPTEPVLRDEPPPERIGRFRITEVLGAGGMGTVYAAHDPELDRAIAVKLVKGPRNEEARARVANEARALAKVAHPNVVTVFDVGTHGDEVFVAMERVRGGTLRAWLATPRSWREIVAMFVAAARGLAAVHAHGLVHRDFKLDNVFVDGERPRVGDFGLAVSEGAEGKAMGTPAYMAPEQFDGGAADARSDQFSFCVALYEALYGERPFAGDTVRELEHAVRAGRIRAPSQADVPAWLRAAVVRGLAPEPAQRYASIDDLVAAIDRDPARTRRRALAGVALAGVLAGGGWWYGARGSDDDACISGAAAIASAWNANRRAALAKHDGGETGDKVAALLDVHAARWRSSHDIACRATRIDKTQSERAMDLRMACLEHRKQELQAVVDRLGRAEHADGAIESVLALPSIAPCDDIAGLEAILPAPAELVVKIDAARQKLADARAAIGLLPANETVTTLQPVVDEALALAYPPLTAAAHLALANALERAGMLRPADTAYRAAAAAADAGRDDRTRFEAWAGLISMLALDSAAPHAARELVPIADGALVRVRGDADLKLLWELTLGIVELAENKPREAAARYRALMDTLEPNDPRIVTVAGGYAAALQRFAPPAETEAAARRARELRSRLYGSGEAERRGALIQTQEAKLLEAMSLLEANKPREAIVRLEGAVAEIARLGGPNHESVAMASEMLGHAQSDADDFAAARASYTRSLLVRRAVHGEQSTQAAESLVQLSRLAHRQRDFAHAVTFATDALAIYDAAKSPRVATAHLTLARALQGQARFDDALVHATRAVELGEHAPWFGGALMVLGELEVARGDVARGTATLERALALRDGSDWDKVGAAQTRLALARARAKQRKTKDARVLAEQAAEQFTTLGKAAQAAEARTFLGTL